MTDLPEPPPTLDLVRAAQGGDQASFDELVERYGPRVLAIVRARLGRGLREVVESQDIVQETMLEVFKGIGGFEAREGAPFLAWVSRIATNQVRRQAERQNARGGPGRHVPEGPAPTGEVGHEVEEDARGPATLIELGEAHARVADAIAELPERYREVILHRDYMGESWDEVAAATGHSTANAARLTHLRAKAQLGSLLGDLGATEG